MRLHIGNLSKETTQQQLKELAKPFGTVVSATLATENWTGESRGFGIVEFSSTSEGNAAMSSLNGRRVDGQKLEVRKATRR